jgi:RNA polymerase sigma-70 factor (ECF subfamily)
VYGISRNVAFESLRQKRLPTAGDMVEDLVHETDKAAMPEEWLAALDHCVERLPEESRKLLRQVYGAGLKMQEAAELVGKSVGAVKVSVFRLREVLRNCIEGFLGGAPWTAAAKK